MNIGTKRGRKPNVKSWDMVLRHTFRSNYIEDADLHTLMFVCGDHLSEIIGEALKEFVSNNQLPTNDSKFQTDVYITAATLTSKNRQKPDATEVLSQMNRTDLISRIHQLANSNIVHTPPEKPPTTTHVPSQSIHPTPKSQHSFDASPSVTPVQKKQPLPLPTVDLGPEIDEDAMMMSESSQIPVVPKTALKDKWLQQHNY